MRIISAQRDYYDCIQASGQDRSLCYVREPEEIYFERGQWPFPGNFTGYRYYVRGYARLPVSLHVHMIGFCGKVYPCLRFGKSEYVGPSNDREYKLHESYCYNVADVDRFLTEHLKKRELAAYLSTDRAWQELKKHWPYDHRRAQIMRFFNEFNHDTWKGLFEEKRCPVFVAEYSGNYGKMTWNGLLGPVQFFKVFEPFAAFQEIAMWLSNQAVPEKVTPVIPDEDKAQAHGFDKWSFRKPPGS